jgi:hypothetical protein
LPSATALLRTDNLAGRDARLALSVERTLKQQRSSGLVDHGTTLPGVAATLRKRCMGDDGRETLIDEPDRNWSHYASERFRKVSCLVSGLSSTSGKASRVSDDNLGHLAVGREVGNLVEITASSPHRL